MNIAIVCEYNPFHFGHLHQMDQIKKNFPRIKYNCNHERKCSATW